MRWRCWAIRERDDGNMPPDHKYPVIVAGYRSMRWREILRESEDYQFHNLIAAMLNQLDGYSQRLKPAVYRELILPYDAVRVDTWIHAYRFFLTAIARRTESGAAPSAEDTEMLTRITAKLPEIEATLTMLDQLPVPGNTVRSGSSMLLGLWLRSFHVQVDNATPMLDQPAKMTILNQLRRAYGLSRAGHGLRAFLAGFKARQMLKAETSGWRAERWRAERVRREPPPLRR